MILHVTFWKSHLDPSLSAPTLPGPLYGIRKMHKRMADTVPDQPDTWLDGSWEPIPHLDTEDAGAGVFAHLPACIFDSTQWGHAQDLDCKFEGSLRVCLGSCGLSHPQTPCRTRHGCTVGVDRDPPV